jgi:hypothetical protein
MLSHRPANHARAMPLGLDYSGEGNMQTFFQDRRYALRMLRKNFLVTAVIVASLAIAIGANSAIFSVVDALLLRPLPAKLSYLTYKIILIMEIGEGKLATVQLPLGPGWAKPIILIEPRNSVSQKKR